MNPSLAVQSFYVIHIYGKLTKSIRYSVININSSFTAALPVV